MEQINTDWKKELKQMYLQDVERNSPDFFRLSGGYKSKLAPKYDDRTANGLTRCVIDFIRLHGGDAQRINTTGTMRKINGQMKWTHSGMRRGTADVHAIIKSKAVSIEIKIGRDKMSKAQQEERERIERAGGMYFVARDMPGFIAWYRQHFQNTAVQVYEGLRNNINYQ